VVAVTEQLSSSDSEDQFGEAVAGDDGGGLDETTLDETSLDEQSLDPSPRRFAGRRAGEILRDLWRPRPAAERAAPTGRAAPSGRAAPTKEDVTGLSRQERMFGFAAAALAAAVTIGLFFEIHNLKGTTARDVALRHQAATVLVAGLLGAALLAAGAWWRRRALLGFAALIVGLALMTFGDILGVVFIFFGGWVIVRHMRRQREERQARTPATGGRGGSTTRRSSAATAAASTARRTPPASKRYTPPKSTPAGATRRR
jgi:hypothetical protein